MLGVDGAKEVVVELNSLSKSQNMAGWRVGMLCARPKGSMRSSVLKAIWTAACSCPYNSRLQSAGTG
jgi:aspartate/methionine/tyrosine aminotransferase